MSNPSKHRRLLFSDCAAAPSCRLRNLHQQNKFSLYHNIIGRDVEDGVRLRSSWETSWEHIHQCYVTPLLRAKRSECFEVAALEANEAAHLHGFVLLVVSALTSALDRDNDEPQLGETNRYDDASELLQLLDQLHVYLGAVEAESNYDVASAADDFTTVLKFCLAVDSARYHNERDRISEGNNRDEFVATGKDRFLREGATVLRHMASSAIVSAMQIQRAERGDAIDLVRYWCLAIASWGRPASVCHKEQCRLILQQFRWGLDESDVGRNSPNGHVVAPYINAAIVAIQECIDEGHQLHVCESRPRAMELQKEGDAISTLFAHCMGTSIVPACYDCTHTTLAKLHVPDLQSDCDVALCLCLIAKQVYSKGLEGNTSREFVRLLYQSLVSTLIASAKEETERSAMVTRILVLGIDFFLRDTKLRSFLLESAQHEKSGEAVPMRTFVTDLVQLILTPPFPSQQYSTTSCTLDIESLLCSGQRDCPEVVAARVLVAYLQVALRDHSGVIESSNNSTDPHLSKEDSNADADGIPLNDVVNICLVSMDSKNQHVVEVVLSSFLCRLWQRDEAVGRAILTKRPDILSSMASVLNRMNGNLVVGRSLAKNVSESWLSLCTCPDDNFRSWMGYVFVRQEAALGALVSLCHEPETSRAALQTLLALSEEISNHRLLARQPGLLPTLIRLVRDGFGPMHAFGPDSAHVFDRETIKQRVLVLAEVL
jgi:hypothetical protein